MVKKEKATGGAYRRGQAEGVDRKDDEGLVADIVRQFSDPYAFYRELVQNAIDAGATRVNVRIVHEESDQEVRISVNDDGTGMSQKILEEDLTVLFKSTKEARDDAIGKFGIGFVSVLALDPHLVAVDTSLGDGVRHRLELHRDHTYDLLRADGGERGTTVTLHVRTETSALSALITRSKESLERWCRHARLPITLFVHAPAAGESGHPEPVRIEKPLGIEGTLVAILGRSEDQKTDVVVGLHPQGTRAAFYNRGLLLYETTETFPRIGAVAFKAVDGHLEHTLSRDDVRRDQHFSRVLSRVESAVHGPLRDAVVRALVGLDREAWTGLFDAAIAAGLTLSRGELHVPLLVPLGGRTTTTLDRFSVLRCMPTAPALAEALAEQGLPVVALSLLDDAPRLAELLRLSGKVPVAGDRHDALIEPAVEPAIEPLLSPLSELLAATARAPSAIATAQFSGAASARLSLGLAVEGRCTAPISELSADPFRLLARPPLLLGLGHPVLVAAKAALARGSRPAAVAGLVARAILSERELLGIRQRSVLLERSLRALTKGEEGA